MKKMYKQPKTEVAVVSTKHMLMDITVSPAGPGGGGSNDAPRRRGDIID